MRGKKQAGQERRPKQGQGSKPGRGRQRKRPSSLSSGPLGMGLDRHVGTPGMGRPMGVEVGQDLSGNPAFLPNANAGGPSSSENIGDASTTTEEQARRRQRRERD